MSSSTPSPAIEATEGAGEALAELVLNRGGMAASVEVFDRLRALGPMAHTDFGTILTGFEECQSVLRDNRFGKLPPDSSPWGQSEVSELRQQMFSERKGQPSIRSTMLFMNQPDHTRQRGLVSRAFTPRRVQALRDRIGQLADAYVEELMERGEADLLEVVGFPTPAAVIGSLVGVPDTDWPLFRRTVTDAAGALEPGATYEELTAAAEAGAELSRYFLGLVASRRQAPEDDLVSALIAVDHEGERLGDVEIVSIIMLIFAAGFETTTNLIGNGMAALLQNPDQQKTLWENPDLCSNAVEEMLRWDSPVQFDVRRSLTDDADLLGLAVRPGRPVILLLGAANRDPAKFKNPHRFDVQRDEGPALSFAAGIHYCLGANLARAEGQEVFRALVERCSKVELAGELVRRPRLTLQGFEAVPVRVTPR